MSVLKLPPPDLRAEVEHKDDSTWLCNIGAKYVFLAPCKLHRTFWDIFFGDSSVAASSLKGMSDRQKFEVARKLKVRLLGGWGMILRN